MLKNYLKITFRNLTKKSVYSFINILGLAIGLSCSLLIMLWVNDELNYDGFHQNKHKLYQLEGNSKGDGGEIFTQRAMPLPLVEELKANERDIEYIAATDWGGNHLLVAGERRFLKEGLYAGEDFLKMFSFSLIKGSPTTALKEASGIVLTKAMATALFGSEDVLGKMVRVDDKVDAVVTGVVENVPSNSTLQFEFLLPFSSYINSQGWVKNALSNWENNSFQIYAQLTPSASVEDVHNRIKSVITKHSKRSDMEVVFHPVTKWRLWSRFENGKPAGGGIEQVRMFSIVALFILIIACINFMNLATARSERRAKEVGIRKSVGSRRTNLIFQFLGESLMVVTIAFIVSLMITELALPFYNNLTGKKLFIDYGDPLFWAISFGIITITGLVAGSYPAFYLSSFNAASVLKGRVHVSHSGATPRKILVVFQFGFSIFLLIGTVVFNQQIKHGKTREIGYNQENLLFIENQGDIQKNFKVIKQELISKGFATAVTQANSPITEIYAYMGDLSWKGKREDQLASFATQATAYDYTKTVGIKVVEGRDFSEDFNDSSSMLLNRAAVDYMGLKNPIGESIVLNGKTYTVVGVTENVLMASAYQPIDPMIILYDPDWFAYAMVRLPKGDVSENIKHVEAIFREYNPAYPFNYQFADLEFQKKFSRIQMITQVANLFALLAIVISCLGLFGLASFTAEQRTKEIGIRKVLGASVSGVVLLLSKDFARLVIVAFVIAAPLAWWALDNWLEAYPYRIHIQWWVLILAGGAALLLATLTVSSLALRAANSNPAQSLRSE